MIHVQAHPNPVTTGLDFLHGKGQTIIWMGPVRTGHVLASSALRWEIPISKLYRSLIVLCSHLPHYINPCRCALLPSRVNKCHPRRLQDTDRPYLCFLRLAPMTIVTGDCRKAPDKGALIHLHHGASARTNSAPKSQIS